MGATFPIAARAVVRVGTLARDAGALYAANTLGAAAGAIVAGFVLIPALGLRGTTVAGVVLNALAAAGAFARVEAGAARGQVRYAQRAGRGAHAGPQARERLHAAAAVGTRGNSRTGCSRPATTGSRPCSASTAADCPSAPRSCGNRATRSSGTTLGSHPRSTTRRRPASRPAPSTATSRPPSADAGCAGRHWPAHRHRTRLKPPSTAPRSCGCGRPTIAPPSPRCAGARDSRNAFHRRRAGRAGDAGHRDRLPDPVCGV